MVEKIPPTMRDVARVANVGTTTVSRVINGGHRVKPATMARVEQAILSLGFRPNHAARVLKGQRTRTIGIIVPSIADPFFAAFASAAQQVARSRGYVAILGACDSDRHAEESQVEELARHRVDGLLICVSFPRNRRLLALLEALRMPVVTFDRPIPRSTFPRVIVDNRKAARDAVRHLIGHGHRHVACFRSARSLFTTRQRVEGYRDAIRQYGYPEMISEDGLSQEAVHRSLVQMLDSNTPPAAIFSTKNQVTIFLFNALQALGCSVPRDIALIGFDDFDSAAVISPSVTVVRQPVIEIGTRATLTLFEQIEQPSCHKNERVVLDTELYIRESCGCRPGATKTTPER